MGILRVASFALLSFCATITEAVLHVHDNTFVPDAILRITAENLAQSCLPPKSTILINGTAPGPELRLQEGRTTWIRVYNDMQDQNLTMVCTDAFIRPGIEYGK